MSIYDYNVLNGYEEEVSLHEYKGKVMLIMNSATRCGFTKQYDELQDLYEKYVDDEFVILDFPCNQFGNQAPGSYEEIVSFCDATFGIKFPIFSKIEVKGENAHPLFKYLASQKPFEGFGDEHPFAAILRKNIEQYSKESETESKSDIKWNFTKFLIDRDGNVVKRYEPTIELDVIEDDIRELL